MDEFIKYWDEVIREWAREGEVPAEEAHWFAKQDSREYDSQKKKNDANKYRLHPELMPEPYYGDPKNCSLVIIHYNPGCALYDIEKDKELFKKDIVHKDRLNDPTGMCHHYANNYSEMAKKGGYLYPDAKDVKDTNLGESGIQWWSKRLKWIKELTDGYGSTQPPFALELCGWHSNRWARSYSKKLLETVADRLKDIIEQSILQSDLGIGLCVGSAWSNSILPAMGYKDVTREVMQLVPDSHDNWYPLNNSRAYRILCNSNGVYIINTWISKGWGGMMLPGKRFRPIEKEMIEAINNHRKANP